MHTKYILFIVVLNLGAHLFAGEPGTSKSHATQPPLIVKSKVVLNLAALGEKEQLFCAVKTKAAVDCKKNGVQQLDLETKVILGNKTNADSSYQPWQNVLVELSPPQNNERVGFPAELISRRLVSKASKAGLLFRVIKRRDQKRFNPELGVFALNVSASSSSGRQVKCDLSCSNYLHGGCDIHKKK